MRCPQCNLFVSYGDGEVSVESEDVQDDGSIQVQARLALPCEQCGTELKEAYFDLEDQLEVEGHDKKGHELTATCSDEEMTTRTQFKGRYTRTWYGVSLTATVECECGDGIGEVTLSDETTASSMEECC